MLWSFMFHRLVFTFYSLWSVFVYIIFYLDIFVDSGEQ